MAKKLQIKPQTNWTSNLPKYFIIAFFGVGVYLFASKFFGGGETASVAVTIPASLSTVASQGQDLFKANCATCHGSNASGSDQGPPLVHDIYNPGHHSDEAFYRAVKQGVRQHHWPFGNMPAQPQVSEGQLAKIVQYVRELQQANGIFYRPHRM